MMTLSLIKIKKGSGNYHYYHIYIHIIFNATWIELLLIIYDFILFNSISSSSTNDDDNDDDDDGKWIDQQMISDPVDVDEDSLVDNDNNDKVSLISSDVNMSLERHSNSSQSTTKHLRRGVTHIDLVHQEHENTYVFSIIYIK